MVTFTGTVGATINGVVINYNPEYTARTNAAQKYNTIDVGTTNIAANDQYYVQLGEELYDGDLQLDNGAIDVFGRPSRYWEYDGDEIGTYAKVELLAVSYIETVEGGDIYNDIGSAACDYELAYYVDGAELNPNDTAIEAAKLERRNDNVVGETGRGVLTQVYVDSRAEETTIVETHTYLAIAQSDYNERNENIRLDVYYDVYNAAANNQTAEPTPRIYRATVDLEDQPVIEGMEADDIVMVTMAAPDHSYVADRDDYTIESIADPEIVSGVTVTDYSVGNDIYADENMPTLSNLTADGTRYNASKDAIYDEELLFNYSGDVESQMRDATYDMYLDAYGNILGLKQVNAADNYLFVVGYDVGSDILAKAIDRALVIFPDGTMKQVNIDDSKLQVYDGNDWVDAPNNRLVDDDEESVNAWFTYTVDDDGLYTLRRMVKNQGMEDRTEGVEAYYIDSMHGTLTTAANPSYRGIGHEIEAATAYGNNDSVYITVKADNSVNQNNSIVDVRGVTTGLRNASIRPEDTNFTFGTGDWALNANTYFMYNGNGYVTYAVVVGQDGAANSEYVYLTSEITRTTNDRVNDRYLYTYEAIVNGEWTTVQSEVTRATVGQANNGDIDETNTSRDLTAGRLYMAEMDNDGVITDMILLPETPDQQMYPERNADYGYTYKVDSAEHNGTDDITLKTNGLTLWVINEETQNNYTLLTEDVVFFVQNPAGDDDDYDVFTDAAQAIRATEANNVDYIYSVATVNDPITGRADTVIIDLVYENEPTAPDAADVYNEFDSVTANLSATGSASVTAKILGMKDWDVSNNANVQVTVTNPEGKKTTVDLPIDGTNVEWTASAGTLTINSVPGVRLINEGTYKIEVNLTFKGAGADTKTYSVDGATTAVQF